MRKFVISIRDKKSGAFSVSSINCSGRWDALRSMTKEPNNMNWMPILIKEDEKSIMVSDENYDYLAIESN